MNDPPLPGAPASGDQKDCWLTSPSPPCLDHSRPNFLDETFVNTAQEPSNNPAPVEKKIFYFFFLSSTSHICLPFLNVRYKYANKHF